MIQLRDDTKTVVVICAFARYDAPGPSRQDGRTQLAELQQVGPAVARLQALLDSPAYRAAGIEAVPLLGCSSRADLKLRLAEVREAVRSRSGAHMVLFWSGHGGLDGGSFRLATPDTYDPIEQEDGVGLDEVARDAGIARVRSWTLLLDACYAGAGFGDVVAAANRRLMGESGMPPSFGALFASAPYEPARDSVLLNAVVDALERGPTAAAKAFGARQGGGGRFNPHDRLLDMAELFKAVRTEYLADTARFRQAQPPISIAIDSPYLFPNPDYRPDQPSRLVEDAYRAIARHADLQAHFFPKAVGLENLEQGWHFSGRVEATRDILRWMNAGPDALYVLAADGGTGKSALLGRLVALTDPEYRARALAQGWDEAADQAAGTVPAADRIDAALNLRNLTAQGTAHQLADILRIERGDTVERFVQSLPGARRRADERPLCLVLDALDEAEEPAAIVQRVVHPLARAGCRLLVATRPSASARGAADLLKLLGTARLYRLDHDAHSRADIEAYARGRLARHARLAGVAAEAARTIADRADNKFLYARMATSALLRNAADVEAGPLDRYIARNATDALEQDLAALDAAFRQQFGRADAGATAMLGALAWAQGEGVPLRDGIWAAMATALADAPAPAAAFDTGHLLWLLREAGRYIQEAGDGEQAIYRLFHRSLVEHFVPGRAPGPQPVEERLARALVQCVRASQDWRDTNPYLVRHMPAHLAARPGQQGLNELLANFDWIEARLRHGGVHALLHDYLYCDAAWPATARLHRTLSMVAHILQADPGQLIAQLLGRIAPGVPDLRALLDSRPGANFGLPPPGRDGLDATQRLLLQAPDLDIERAGPALAARTLRLDGLLVRARAALAGPSWLPALGGLAQAGALVAVLPGHAGGVTGVAVVAQAGIVVSGGHGGMVRVWDARTGALLRQMQAGTDGEDAVRCLAASQDGRVLACGGIDGSVRLLDLQSGAMLGRLQGHAAPVCCLALAADGKTLASGDLDGELRLWSLPDGLALRTHAGAGREVRGVALGADGRRAAWAVGDRLYSASAPYGSAPPQVHALANIVHAVALGADGHPIACGDNKGGIHFFDGAGAALRQVPRAHADTVGALAFGPDGSTLVSGGWDSALRIWDARQGTLLQTLRGHESFIGHVAIGADGRTVASAGLEDSVRVWDTQVGAAQTAVAGHASWIYGLAASPDGTTLMTGGGDATLRSWDAATGAPLLQLPLPADSSVFCVAALPAGAAMVSGGTDHAVRVWNRHSGAAVRVLQGHGGWVNCIVPAPDGDTFFTGSDDRTVRQWDAGNGKAWRVLQAPGQVSALAIARDGSVLLAACNEGTVCQWNPRTATRLRDIHSTEPVRSLVLHPDGRTLLGGTGNGVIRWWDLATGAVRHETRPHRGMVFSLALSPDGRTLVSGGQDGSVQMHDAGSGGLLQRLDVGAAVHAVVFFCDGEGRPAIAAAGGSAVVRLLRAD